VAKTETLDEELVAGLKMAKTRRCGFALVVKGASDGALVISKQKVPPALITLAKKKCGGTSVIQGAVFVEDGQYVFEVESEPAATLPNALKLIAKRDAGMTIVAVCRLGTGDLAPIATATPAAGTTAAGTTAAGTTAAKGSEPVKNKPAAVDETAKLAAAYQSRVNALSDALKKAIVAGNAAGKAAMARFSESQGASQKKRLREGTGSAQGCRGRNQESACAAGSREWGRSCRRRESRKRRTGVR
jgi:hypothetical protein